MTIITATSWNGTTFYYNQDKGRFDMADNCDLSASDHYESNEQNLESAKQVAEKDGLKEVHIQKIEL